MARVTKEQLGLAIQVLKDEVERTRRELAAAREENYSLALKDKEIGDLKQKLLDATVEIRQLRGYCARVREEDALRVTGAPLAEAPRAVEPRKLWAPYDGVR